MRPVLGIVAPEVFWARVTRGEPSACWPWRGRISQYGYGTINVRRYPHLAHRIAYAFATGTDPGRLCVCHTCDNRACCNPAHLWLGTNEDNTSDRVAKGRTLRGSESGVATLDETTAGAIKAELAAGGSPKRIALRFRVSRNVVTHIKAGRAWRHVEARPA